MPALLVARGIDKRFGGTAALRGVDFTLEEGEVHALLGENGAGKSTLSKIIAGVVTPDAGELRLRGSRVRITSPVVARSLGIGMVFQELDLFPHLSVAENLAIANPEAGPGFVVHPQRVQRWSVPHLEQAGLDVDPAMPLHALSAGQIQLVAIARALSQRSRIILMDEPTSSLSDTNVDTLFAVMRRLKAEGVSFVYVSHKMNEVTRIADRVTVLRDGAYVGTVPADGVTQDALIHMMVGRIFDRTARTSRARREILLDVRDLASDFVRGVRFRLHAGEVLGLAGLVGSGRTEVGRALFGIGRHRRIDADLSGRPFAPASPAGAIRSGLCLLPEERRTEGLFPHMSATANTSIAVLTRARSHGMVSGDLERSITAPVLARLKLASARADAAVSTLSGGNQQKTIMARWLLADPKVLFLDEPTRGIDIGAKEEIYGIIDELAAQGRGVLLASSELPELLRCCDRILVLHEGRQTGIVDTSTSSQEQVLALAAGLDNAPPRP